MSSVLPQKIAFLDIETTGLSVSYDRIIEIGILIAENGKIKKKFQSLINPGGYLPPEITFLTGISSGELENAPVFREIQKEISEILEGTVLAAHNVRFDYGFLKQEFKRLDKSFSMKHFCTVKLAKALFPNLGRYNLDSIISNFNIKCKNRHRAFDDAKVIFDFYKIALKKSSPEKLLNHINLGLKKPSIPTRISEHDLNNLPESSGVYVFYGINQNPLYIGKSINIKERILSHFSNDHSSNLEMKIAQQIERIETFKTAGELGALMLESTMVKKLKPLFNRKLRKNKLLTIVKQVNINGFESVEIETTNNINPEDLGKIIGVFRNIKSAKEFLLSFAKKYNLCEKLLNLEKTKGACFGYRLEKCFGACKGSENSLKYNLRFLTAFAGGKFKSWPFKGPIIIEEKNLEDKSEMFVINNWCFLGGVKNIFDGGIKEILKNEYNFDLDNYKILKRFLSNPKNLKMVKAVNFEKQIELTDSQREEFIPSP